MKKKNRNRKSEIKKKIEKEKYLLIRNWKLKDKKKVSNKYLSEK